mmetsp:Transcript_23081/g.64095  ORF Transcript_23081/g.64095 Transcript_23081/m.64095 type:complete len:202 (+) Transcript_23081:736-1341(+)
MFALRLNHVGTSSPPLRFAARCSGLRNTGFHVREASTSPCSSACCLTFAASSITAAASSRKRCGPATCHGEATPSLASDSLSTAAAASFSAAFFEPPLAWALCSSILASARNTGACSSPPTRSHVNSPPSSSSLPFGFPSSIHGGPSSVPNSAPFNSSSTESAEVSTPVRITDDTRNRASSATASGSSSATAWIHASSMVP